MKDVSMIYFSQDDDFRLAALVAMYGSSNWSQISRLMMNKNERQCKERWTNYMNPSVKKDGFTEEENTELVGKVSEKGFRWKAISKDFEGRTEAMIKNQYKVLQRSQQKTSETHSLTRSQNTSKTSSKTPTQISSQASSQTQSRIASETPSQTSSSQITDETTHQKNEIEFDFPFLFENLDLDPLPLFAEHVF
jgi:hypothetical protein